MGGKRSTAPGGPLAAVLTPPRPGSDPKRQRHRTSAGRWVSDGATSAGSGDGSDHGAHDRRGPRSDEAALPGARLRSAPARGARLLGLPLRARAG